MLGRIETEFKKRMDKAGVSCADLVRATAINYTSINKWLNGTYDLNEDDLKKITRHLEKQERNDNPK